MNKKELIERLKKGKYYYILDDLIISSKVNEVLCAGTSISIQFEAGDVAVEFKNIIEDVEVSKYLYEWAYELKGKKGEYLGKIFKAK